MSKATLIIGFKFNNITALQNHLIAKYYTEKNLTKALPVTDPTTDAAKATYYAGSIYENWYGWTPTQKYNAYKTARQKADTEYNTARTTINSYIRKFNTGDNVIVGVPLVELNDTSNGYKLIVSKMPNSNDSEYGNSVTLNLTDSTVFKQLVTALKISDKPKFYIMNATSGTNPTINT